MRVNARKRAPEDALRLHSWEKCPSEHPTRSDDSYMFARQCVFTMAASHCGAEFPSLAGDVRMRVSARNRLALSQHRTARLGSRTPKSSTSKTLAVECVASKTYSLLLKTFGGIPPDAIRILGSNILKVVFAVIPERDHRIHVFGLRDHEPVLRRLTHQSFRRAASD